MILSMVILMVKNSALCLTVNSSLAFSLLQLVATDNNISNTEVRLWHLSV